MKKTKLALLILATAAAMILSGCQTAGSAMNGVGGLFNSGGNALKRL